MLKPIKKAVFFMLLGAFVLSVFTACMDSDPEKGNTESNAINGHVSDDESHVSGDGHDHSRSDVAEDLSEFFSRVESDVDDLISTDDEGNGHGSSAGDGNAVSRDVNESRDSSRLVSAA